MRPFPRSIARAAEQAGAIYNRAMELHLNSESSAQQWIDHGFARRTQRGRDADLRSVSFLVARAQSLVHLTGAGAQLLDHVAKEHAGRP